MLKNKKIKLIVILGPTASGKTRLAVELASKINGEIISADSRQVYRGMDVGTGKDLIEYKDIAYHLIDVAEPKEQFTVADFKRATDAVITEIAGRGKAPMLVGGSGLYLQAVVDNFALQINTGADLLKRSELEVHNTDELFVLLSELNPTFAERLNNSDRQNKRRLIRYVELNEKPVNTVVDQPTSNEPIYDCLIIGLMPDKELMLSKIEKRLHERLEKEDMVEEVAGLRRAGVSDERLKEFGLEYRFITEYLEEKYTYEQMTERLLTAIRQFAKRQITWFRRWEKQGRVIHWVTDVTEAERLIEEFLN
jgi:tRNA dimethylallyltransferase